jgi:hypothetical protein
MWWMVRIEAEISASVCGLSVDFGGCYCLIPDVQIIQKRNQLSDVISIVNWRKALKYWSNWGNSVTVLSHETRPQCIISLNYCSSKRVIFLLSHFVVHMQFSHLLHIFMVHILCWPYASVQLLFHANPN